MHEQVAEAFREEAAGNPKKAGKAIERFYRGRSDDVTDEDLIAAMGWVEERQRTDPQSWLVDELRRFIRSLVVNNPARFPETVSLRQAAAAAHEAAAVEARASKVQAARAEAASRMLMTTTPDVPGRVVESVITVVSGACVMSRNVFSDFGSDATSIVGGALGGIEKAIETARRTALSRLEEAAEAFGADAVIGIDTSVQTVSDKAQLVMLTGTAVTLRGLEPN